MGLRERVRESGYRQRWMAERVGVTPEHLSAVVNGKTRAGRKVREGLVRVLGVSEEELFGEVCGRSTTEPAPTGVQSQDHVC